MDFRKYIFLVFVLVFYQNGFSQVLKKAYEKEIYFDFGKDEIREDQLKTLQVFMRAAKANHTSKIFVYGFTDNIDSKKFNYKLGLRRALKVKNYLIEKGIDSSLIQIKSEGGTVYKASNKTEDGRAINRRVLLSIQPLNQERPPAKKSNFLVILTDINTKKIIKGNLEIRMTSGGNMVLDSLIRYNVDRTTFYFAPNYYYSMVASADGYITKDTLFQLIDTNKKEIYIALTPYVVKEKLVFDKIHFKPNLSEFQSTASTDLLKLLNYMRKNKETSIEIVGHINYPVYRPTMSSYEEYFFYDLSVKRAKAVKNYLVQNGIEDRRLYYKGLSNKQMIYPEANEMSQYLKNMRVEVMVLK